jgi:conjugal transfer ATP-binding protein TraC
MSFVESLKYEIKKRFVSSSTLEDKGLYSYFHFSDYIRPTVQTEDGLWLTNDGEYTWICELSPRLRMGSETSETFEQALSKIPEGFFTQIILFGSKNIENFLTAYKSEKNSDNQLVINAVDQFSKFLRQKTKEPINQRFSTQIKNNRVIFVLKNKDLNALKTVKESVYNILNSNHFYPYTLNSDELKILFYEFVNPSHDMQNIPEYNERKFFNKQIMTSDNKIYAHKDHLIIDKKYYKALTPLKYPKKAHIAEFGLKLGDYLTKGMDSNQFVDNYIITLNLTRTHKSEISTIKRNKQITKGGRTTGNKVKKEKTEIDNIIDNIEERKPMFKVDLNIWISGNTLEQVTSNSDRIKSFWQKKTQKGEEEIGGIVLEDFTYALIPLFIGSLPAGPNKEYFKLITKTNDENHFVDEVCQFLPLEADWQGNYPNLIFSSRRGQLCGIDMYLSDYAKNGFIVAQSGSGKSVLANYIAFNQYSRGYKTFIVDIGESYKNLCEHLQGQYISIDPSRPISFNPLYDLQNIYQKYLRTGDSTALDEVKDQLDYLSNFTYMIGSNLNALKAQEEEKFIKGTLQEVIENLLDKTTSEEECTKILEIDDIQKYIFENYQDIRLTDFAVHLKPWCKGGIYYQFVAGKKEVDFNNQLVVLDLSSVEKRADIRDALIYLMVNNIASYVYNNSGVPVQVIVDEVHNFLGKNPHMDSFFDQSYRRFRKHYASIIVITQSFEDIYNVKTGGLSLAGQAIMANSPWKFFLNQNDTAVNAMRQSELFSFSELDWQLLKSTKSIKGYFSEIFLINPHDEKSVLRLVIDRYFYYLTTSDPNDKARIKDIMKYHKCDLSEAINNIITEENKNVA